MSFFTVPGAQKKRKRPVENEGPKKRLASSRSAARPRGPSKVKVVKPQHIDRDDESISGSDSNDSAMDLAVVETEMDNDLTPGSDDDEAETAAENRLRLAERYLDNVQQEIDEVGFNAEDVDRDLLADRLREDAAESKGRVYRRLANELVFEEASHTFFRSDTRSTTSVATCAPYAYTVSKDQYLVKWKLQDLPAHQFPQTTRKKSKKPPAPPRRQPEKIAVSRGTRHKTKDKNYRNHTGEILAVAASQDGRFVVTGGADRRLIVRDAKTLKTLKVFTHHRDAVTGLAFRRGTNQLYSASKDRTIKVWSLDELAYVETLFGHQDEVLDVDALAQERCVTVGALDRTARLWKVVEESQLVFRGGPGDRKSSSHSGVHDGSMDRVTMIDDDLFVTGSDTGSLALWSLQKKKPVFVVSEAHGLDPSALPQEASAEAEADPRVSQHPRARWITALKALPYSDVILTGSWDGFVRVWRLTEDKRRIDPIGVLGLPQLSDIAAQTNGTSKDQVEGRMSWKIKGVINDISMFERGDRGRDGLCVVVAVGKEHRLGRWQHAKGGKNGAVVFEVPRNLTMDMSADTDDTRAVAIGA